MVRVVDLTKPNSIRPMYNPIKNPKTLNFCTNFHKPTKHVQFSFFTLKDHSQTPLQSQNPQYQQNLNHSISINSSHSPRSNLHIVPENYIHLPLKAPIVVLKLSKKMTGSSRHQIWFVVRPSIFIVPQSFFRYLQSRPSRFCSFSLSHRFRYASSDFALFMVQI
jgi:hypothetical protein